MVMIGNPPYSISSQNKGEWINKLLEDYKKNLNERNIQPLSDDYITTTPTSATSTPPARKTSSSKISDLSWKIHRGLSISELYQFLLYEWPHTKELYRITMYHYEIF